MIIVNHFAFEKVNHFTFKTYNFFEFPVITSRYYACKTIAKYNFLRGAIKIYKILRMYRFISSDIYSSSSSRSSENVT